MGYELRRKTKYDVIRRKKKSREIKSHTHQAVNNNA